MTTTSPSGGLCYGRSKVSFGIRVLTQHGGERPSIFNHAFVLRRDGTGGESLMNGGAVELKDYRKKYDRPKYWGITFAVAHVGLDHGEVEATLDEYICAAVRYDKFAIGKCAVDGLLSKLFRRDVFAARRIRLKFWKRVERWHICSWLYTHTHKKGGHAVVGRVTRFVWRKFRRVTTTEILPLERVTPDDIGDDVFLVRPHLYVVTDEFGKRPSWLAHECPRIVAKIDHDLGRT